MLDFRRPKDCRNCEGETQPKFVAKHCHGMAGVAVVFPVAMGHAVHGVRNGWACVLYGSGMIVHLPPSIPKGQFFLPRFGAARGSIRRLLCRMRGMPSRHDSTGCT